MTPQNEREAQMDESAFEKWILSDEQKAQYAKETTSLEGRLNAFKAAYSLQQEKIDKQQVRINELEASYNKLSEAFDDLNIQNNFHCAQMTKLREENKSLSEMVKSQQVRVSELRSDLDTVTERSVEATQSGLFMDFFSVVKTIRTRHKLDAHDGEVKE